MKVENIEFQDIIYTIWVGENAQDNWNIISAANQNDIWFHLSNFPSAHVIIKIPDNFKLKFIPKQLYYKCASICKVDSKYCNIKKVKVIYTEIKHVTKGDKVGSVHTTRTKELTI